MSREELALETQLLLQEVTQITQNEAVESVLEDANAPQPVSELETAKQALLEKLKRKKEANRAQRHQLNQQQYGQVPGKKNDLFSPRKNKQQSLKLPVASTASGGSRKKQNMLTKLKTQAIQQGAQNMAKLFGYSSYEEQLKHLNQIEKKKILQNEMKEKLEKTAGEEVEVDDNEDVEMQEEDVGETEAVEQDGSGDTGRRSHVSTEPESEKLLEQVLTAPKNSHNDVSVQVASPVNKTAESAGEKDEHEDQDSVVVVKRRNMIRKQDVVEEDGNEADSEQDDKEGDDEDADVDVAMDTAAGVAVDTNEQDAAMEEGEGSSKPEKSTTPKDKAAGYRNLLRAEALQNRRRKRLVKGRGDNFVESEAEEDEEEDVLKIGGLGDFGFGVPQATTQESKEAEEERNALKLREDDLDHIVDDISDDERAQEQDLDEMFRREQEDQDRQQVKEVMRNVKEGFGRNRRAFSGLHSGSEARGRFNLDELVAADGSKFEAARLGLLESDEELSEGEDGSGEKKKVNADGEEEEENELDEEAEMERMLRERFMNQPKIYVTSSESGSDNEDENDAAKEKTGADNDEIESDEERERQQMKLFSERARVNRRMQRMKDLRRQIALENNEADPNAKAKTIPNVLLEEDADSQELMHLLNRTDVDAAPTNTANGSSHTKARPDRPRPKLGRFNSYGGITSSSRGSSSFSRVIGQCKMFSANTNSSGGGSSKGFVFTSFSADKPEQDGDENAAPNNDESVPTARPDFAKSKSWSGAGSKASAKRRGAPGGRAAASSKKRKSGGLFSVLSSYQCVSSTSQNTCSYHASKEGESCRQPRTCYECLNADIAGVKDGCLLAPSGFCEDMSSYEANLDYRRNTAGEDLSLTGWYNYYPSVNATYCEPTDAACVLCDELVNNGSLSQSSHREYKTENTSTEVERQFCVGTDGCVCVMSCETDNWEVNMPAECGTSGSESANNGSSSDATTYSTMLIFYLVLQVALLGVFMYRRGLCKRMGERRPPVRAEGPYNNVNAITSPSNRLRLSGWRKMQNTLIEREKKQLANQQPQYMMSPRVESVTVQTETSNNPQQSPVDSSPNSDSARAVYAQVQDDPNAADSNRERNCSLSPDREVVDQVAGDIVVVGASYEERITSTSAETTRDERTSSECAMLEAHRSAV
ncbi:hypothetical protein BBP00_00004549 [Phytophthora kernoviae]|uniref:Uncharacterized protein n=1 Tax=Phytophthora kernoviae TaxID=325452 RepID=A0A3F2RRG7_9STRA|nr:hypothetical protein BBP00_00004549 [Phytophthora kernoviae]